MATIKTSIALYDGVTVPLKSMHKAMNIVLNSFEAMQRASKNSVDTSSIREARDELTRAGAAFDSIEQNIRDAGNQQDKFTQKIRNGATASDGLWKKLKGIAATVGGLATAKKIIQISDDLASTKARLNLLVDDGGSVSELEQKIMASAERSRSAYFDTSSAVAKLGLNAGAAFDNDMDQVIAFMEQVNKQFVIGGATAQEQSNAMIQLTQAMAAGALRGEELNSILDGAPGIARAIEQYMGIAQGSIKTVAEDGKVTAEVVKNAMFAMADETNQKFESMPKTWAQIWTSMKNKALSVFNPILNKINQLANSEKFNRVVDGLISGLAGVARIASAVLDLMINIASAVIDNWSWIGPIIMGVVAALLVYKAVALIATVVTTIQTAAAIAKANADATQASATLAAAAAQHGLNAALLACPLMWIIILIMALIVLFVIFTEEITGAIWWLGALFKNIGLWIANCGIAAWEVIKNVGLWFGNLGAAIWAVIKNIGLWFANLGLGIWEVMKACANNIGVAFSNGWISIQIGFYSLLDSIMQGLKWLADKANQYLGWLGVNIDTSGFDTYSKKIDELNAQRGKYENIGDAWNKGFNTYQYDNVIDAWQTNNIDWSRVTDGFNTFDVFEDGWGSDAYNRGYEVGANLKNSVKDSIMGLFDIPSADTLGAYKTENTLDGIYNNTGAAAENTAAMADALEITEEDLAYLRDIAEREAINRFTTAEIRIEQQNTNYLNGDADLDGIMDAWANDFASKLDVSVEGVHE